MPEEETGDVLTTGGNGLGDEICNAVMRITGQTFFVEFMPAIRSYYNNGMHLVGMGPDQMMELGTELQQIDKILSWHIKHSPDEFFISIPEPSNNSTEANEQRRNDVTVKGFIKHVVYTLKAIAEHY